MSECPIFECYDVGGTNLRGALVSNGQPLVAPVVRPLGAVDPPALVRSLRALSAELRRGLGPGQRVEAVALAVPGPVRGSVLVHSAPLGFGASLDLRAATAPFWSERLFVVNDLNAAVRAEQQLGTGRLLRNYCLLTISTGIGVGVVLEGHVVDRNTEIGHCVVETRPEAANECVGHRGCWAAQAAGLGIARTLARRGVVGSAEDLFAGRLAVDVAPLVAAVRQYHAIGIGTLVNAYDPQEVVVMGSLGMQQFERVVPSAQEIAAFALARPVPAVRPTRLGPDIGLLGAAFYAAERGELS